MLPLILIGLGAISLGATAATIFVQGETEEERKRQGKLRSKHAEYRRKKLEERRAALAPLIAEYRADAETKLATREKVVKEFQAVVDELGRQLSDGQFTPSRRAALFSLRQKFEANKGRLESFSSYLREYIRALDNAVDELPEPPANTLPSGYAHPGALMTLSREQLNVLPKEGNEHGQRLFVFDRAALDHPALESWERIPVLISKGRDGRLGCSVRRGILLAAHLDPGVPFKANVTRVHRNYTDVEAYGVWMRLYRADQRVRYRRPLIGSELVVYGLQYRYDLEVFQIDPPAKGSTGVLVTEREDRAGHEDQFNHIPLWIKTEFEPTVERLASLVESRERWLVAPDPSAETESRVRFQNRDIGFWARFSPVDGGVCLEYEGPLGENDAINTKGIYAAFPATIVPHKYGGEGESDDITATLESCQLFSVFVAREFERQRQILESNEGGLFFRQWEMVTRRLIEAASWSDPFPVELDDVRERPDERWALYPAKAKDVEMWLDLQEGGYVEGFVDGERLGPIESHPSKGQLILEPRKDSEVSQDAFLGAFDIRVRQKPEAERRQLDSLQAFRIGNVVNQRVKTYVLNPKAYSNAPEFEVADISPFDSRISEDDEQAAILRSMVSCPDLYALQGPPGAGKTTVIVELIRQELARSPHARILVTSQANIAVDNVMESLRPHVPAEQLVRCGNPGRISAALQDITLQARFLAYKQEVETTEGKVADGALLTWWRSELSDRVDSHFGEILLRQASVVGATCVYLGNHRKGLDRLDFDLVVVDEAGRATPPELLIPLIRAKRAVVIGDHYQLPPFIEPAIREGKLDFGISRAELDELISHNLFARLHESAPENRRSMLGTTYRLPSQVADLVSQTFYGGKIKAAQAPVRSRIFANTITWADTSRLDGYGERRVGTSLVNHGEARLILDLLHFVVESAWEVFDAKTERPLSVAVLSPYAAQVSLLRRNLAGLTKQEADHGVAIDIDTIDAYQGKEADLVIYAATRSARPSEFLNDRFRLNVALSRVKRELVIIGSAAALCKRPAAGTRSVLSEVHSFISEKGSLVSVERLGRSGLAGLFAEAARPNRAAKQLSGFEENKDVRVLSVHPRRRRWNASSIAVIDVGSTGLRYLGVSPDVYLDGFLKAPADRNHRLFEENERLDLGAGVQEVGAAEGSTKTVTISRRATARLVATIGKVVKRNHGVGPPANQILAVGTSLFRTAENGNEVIELLKQETGVELWPISGLFEATVGLVGLILSQGDSIEDGQPVVTVDLGGGSTEVSLSYRQGTDVVVVHQASIPYGRRALANMLCDDVPDTASSATRHIRELAEAQFSGGSIPDVGEKPLILCMGGAIQRIGKPAKGAAGKWLKMDTLIKKLSAPPKAGLLDEHFHSWFPALISSTGYGKESSAAREWLDVHVAGEALCALMRHYELSESRFYKMSLRHALAYLLSLGWTRSDMEKVLA